MSADQTLQLLKVKIPLIAPGDVNASDFTFVDVREPSEFSAGHLKGALSLPRSEIEKRVKTLIPDKTTPILAYCMAGTRALFAAEQLLRLGYTKVWSLAGGYLRWRELGYATESNSALSEAEQRRYARHLTIPQLGESGQARLLKSKVLVVGLGGLGSPAAFYLAAAGIGTLGLLDFDDVEESNLQRQILHSNNSIGSPKVDSAARTLQNFSPSTKLQKIKARLESRNAAEIISEYDLVLDGTDNFSTRYLLNDVCVRLQKPLVYGSVLGFEGRVAVYSPAPASPCYRCIFPEPPPEGTAPRCVEAGVLGALPGIIGTLQALEAIKTPTSIGEPLTHSMIVFDGLKASFKKFQLSKDASCQTCGTRSRAGQPRPFLS